MKSNYLKIALPVLILFLTALMPISSSAQLVQEKRADKLYDDYAYNKAAELYENLYRKDTANVKYLERLASSYNKMLNYNKAMYYYSVLAKRNQLKPEYYYDYAQLLKIRGKSEESKVWLGKLPEDQRARKQLENANNPKKQKSDVENITLKNLESNTRFTDMCAAYYKDQIVYSSAKDSFSVIKNYYEWNNQPFLDLYVSKPGMSPDTKKDKLFFETLNTRFHEGTVSFSNDYNTIFFTRNNSSSGRVKSASGINNLKIFISDFDGKSWGKIRSFAYNSDNYSVGHPALSPDNKTLYFTSDMPGGFGETDIYKSELVNGEWSKPVNLGETINTKGKEMFPFVDKDGVLFFSSNGQPGLGGLDIFGAKKDESGNYKVIDLPSPINSEYEDFGCVVNKDSLEGYLTSNRTGGKGDDDNYFYKVNQVELVAHIFDDKTKNVLPGSRVALMGDGGKVLDVKIADKDGTASFMVKPGAKFQLLGESNTYLPETKEIQIKHSLFDLVQDESLYLKRGFPYLTIQVVDKATGLIIPTAIVDISEGKYDNSELEDNKGVIRMKMEENTEYKFYATAVEYFDKTDKYSSVGKEPGEYALTIELEKMEAGKQFVLEDLFYDLDKFNIRPDAALVLDKLIRILTDNPEIRIEIGSHTDSRATTAYNQKLSQNRSASVVAYMVKKGIAPGRLVAKGYGESQLVNKCADGVPCTEEEHQANRRTVITILNKDIKRAKRGSRDVYYF